VLQSIQVLDVAKLLHIVELKITSIDIELEKLEAIRLQLLGKQEVLLQKKTNHIISLPEMKLAA